MPGLAGRVVVMPGGGGVPVAGPVVVWARTGHAISAVVAIMVPIEACLAMVNLSPFKTVQRTAAALCSCARFGYKRTCGRELM